MMIEKEKFCHGNWLNVKKYVDWSAIDSCMYERGPAVKCTKNQSENAYTERPLLAIQIRVPLGNAGDVP